MFWTDISINYRTKSGSYTVKFPAQKQVGSAKQAPGLVKQARRINLCFDQEDHPHFLRRVAYAEAAREETKSVIRFEHYINSQPGAGSSIRPIQPETLTGVHQRVMSTIPAALKAQLEAETLVRSGSHLKQQKKPECILCFRLFK